MSDRDEMLVVLIPVARRMIDFAKGKQPVPGWPVAVRGWQVKQYRDGPISGPRDEDIEALLEEADDDQHAFDALTYLAAQLSAAGEALPEPLRVFAGQVLTGQIKRPSKGGRRNEQVLVRAQQYSMALFTHHRGGVPLTRSKTSDNISACDLVATAFTDAGRRTTYERLDALCFAENYAAVRSLGKLIYPSTIADIESEMARR